KIASGVVALPQGQLVHQSKIATGETQESDALTSKCIAQLQAMCEWVHTQDARLQGIGVGVAELVDLNGIITSAATFPWNGVNLAAEFSFLAPTIVDTDVRAAAFAEAHFGAGRTFKIFAYITIGTGISACLVQNGMPFAGARGNALLLGSSTLKTDSSSEFILERFVSGSALVNRFNAISEKKIASGQDVVRAMEQGDSDARAIIESAGDTLGMGIALYVNLLDPEAVIIGGGLGSAGGIYWERAVASARKLIWADNTRDLPILHAGLGENAGVIGAAALARQRLVNE
ncbi:MAG TPA: ROK family protein, partial [Anaerolineae bacterium]|nr:ROK family protein [Anaerolineae bacterium]